jgi:DNA-binding NarL/FixJ family response regulator
MKKYPDNTTSAPGVRTILVFADELAVLVDLRTALKTDGEFKLLGMSSSSTEIVRRAAESQPDLVLFWFRTVADLLVITELRSAAPDAAIVMCVAHGIPPDTSRRAIALGVRGFLSMTAGWDIFKECLHLTAPDVKSGASDHSALPLHSLALHPVRLDQHLCV